MSLSQINEMEDKGKKIWEILKKKHDQIEPPIGKCRNDREIKLWISAWMTRRGRTRLM